MSVGPVALNGVTNFSQGRETSLGSIFDEDQMHTVAGFDRAGPLFDRELGYLCSELVAKLFCDLTGRRRFEPVLQKQVVAYLNAALEDGDHAVLLEALRNVAQSRGMSALAKAAGVSRESLYRSLSRRGNPKIETIIQLLRALGLRLAIERRSAA